MQEAKGRPATEANFCGSAFKKQNQHRAWLRHRLLTYQSQTNSFRIEFWAEFVCTLLCFKARTALVLQEPKTKTNETRTFQFFSILKLKQKAFKLARKEEQETDAKYMQETRQREEITATIEHEQKNRPGNENFKMICYNDNRVHAYGHKSNQKWHKNNLRLVFKLFNATRKLRTSEIHFLTLFTSQGGKYSSLASFFSFIFSLYTICFFYISQLNSFFVLNTFS